MTLVEPAAPAEVAPAQADQAWIADLTRPGAAGLQAQRQLHNLLLRAARRHVWRARHQLPGIGAGELEDLAQQAADDALVAVLAKLETFEGHSRFSTWVYKFAVLHAGVAVRRQAWRHREVHLPDTVALTDRDATPDVTAEAQHLARAVEEAIAHDLTPHQRQVTLALLVEQVPIDVLAEHLGSTRNALYKTLHDARQRLRSSLVASGHLDATPRSIR